MIDAMSPNTLRARLTFSYQGNDIALESIIDLDCGETGEDTEPNFHHRLARAANIDPYSYQYEVLESEEIAFDLPTGLATACCAEGRFDWAAFVKLCRDERDLEVVRGIALHMLEVGDLDADARLKAALLATYQAGLNHRK